MNYRFSRTPAPDPLEKGATVTDQIIHAVRRQGNVGFVGHELDFEPIPEDQRDFERDVNLSRLQALRSEAEMSESPTQRLFVDERYR